MGALEIFRELDKNYSSHFTLYRAELQVRGYIVGGVPKDKETIKAWLKARLEMDDRALVELTEQTAAQMQEETGVRPGADQLLDEVSAQYAKGNGFKRIEGQLVYEGRCAKAMLNGRAAA